MNQSLSPHIRRRLSFENMKEEMDNIIDYSLNPCGFDDASEFVAEACDWMVNNYTEEISISPKDKDILYFFFVDKFGKYLYGVYNENCDKTTKSGLQEEKIYKTPQDLVRNLPKELKKYYSNNGVQNRILNGIPRGIH